MNFVATILFGPASSSRDNDPAASLFGILFMLITWAIFSLRRPLSRGMSRGWHALRSRVMPKAGWRRDRRVIQAQLRNDIAALQRDLAHFEAEFAATRSDASEPDLNDYRRAIDRMGQTASH